MAIILSGTNDIIRRNGELPDEVLATKSGPSLTAEEVAFLETLPPQSSLKQAYLQSTAKTVLQGFQVEQVQELISGNRIADTASRDITIHDNAKTLTPTTGVTYTIPVGLTPMPSFTVDCPAAGTVVIARAGAPVTLNGAGTSLTRTRANNPVGFVVLAHSETDAYGVSGS